MWHSSLCCRLDPCLIPPPTICSRTCPATILFTSLLASKQLLRETRPNTQMPHFANDFRSVRRQLSLLPSRVLPNGELGPPPPPYFNTKSTCSCACTCGAARDVDNGHNHGAHTPHFDAALEGRDALPMREILAGTDALSLLSTAPSSPDPSFSSRSTSSSVSSMSMLAGASVSTDALALSAAPGMHAPRRPFGLSPRFRLHSTASMSSLNV